MKQSKMMQRILGDENFIDSMRGSGTLDNLRDNYIEHLEDSGKLSIKDMLKDKSFLKKNRYNLNDLKNDYLEYMEDEGTSLTPKSTAKQNYIGIEIECFTHYDRVELLEKILDNDLSNMVQPVGDGSIEPDFGDDVELRVLIPEKSLKASLKKVEKLLVKNKFGVNDSCGLHIHLDMRNRDVDKCYKRLLKFQDVLFGMVDRERWGNDYCKFTREDGGNDRYVAINRDSYNSHKTIEVRLHQATLDMKLIEKWINLLLRVINTGTSPKMASKADVLKWAKKQPKPLQSYIKKHFNEKWFERKKRVVGGDYDDEGYF